MKRNLVLVVDDEASIRESIIDLLEVEGFECLSAGNGKEAFEVLAASVKKPNVILLDLMMPTMSGEEFLDVFLLSSDYSQIPVILISAAQHAQKVAQDKKIVFVRKPLDADVLLNAIEKVI